jgi:asparagine synthase (glutamine-hydrolysing)
MCGIIGIFNRKNPKSLVERSLDIIKNRGKDGQGTFIEGKSGFGHVLHAVVGSVRQPFIKGRSRFIINGEIYNWRELNQTYKLGARNDSETVFFLLEKLGPKKIIDVLDMLDGVFAFCWWNDDFAFLCRDIIGVKPIWYSLDNGFSFCSEKKALQKIGITNILELNPRSIIKHNTTKKQTEFIPRTFFKTTPEIKDEKEKIEKKTKKFLIDAIKKRIPDRRFGILFSGGIDSTFIAYAAKKMKNELGQSPRFTCYTAALESSKEAIDLTYAKKVADAYGLELKYKVIKLDEVEDYLKKVVPLIEDSNVVKVGVALTFYVACKLAREDNIKVIFSGLGSEEIFAGYDRHKHSLKINEECLSGLRRMYERDLYRDDVITMNNNLELRLPFLDKKLIEYALKIPEKYKLDKTGSKLILRNIAKNMGIDEDIAIRPKKAAQYGSRFDKAIEKLAKKSGTKSKSLYLKRFYPSPNLKLAALISGGKDSFYAMHIMQKQNYEISCMVTLRSKNQDSYMFHTPNIDLVESQAKACLIPLISKDTTGEKEKELEDLTKALENAKQKYGIQGVVSGAIFSNYQRERIEKVCDNLGLKIFSPLWHMDQELEMRNLLDEGFEFILSSIGAEGLDRSWLGRSITHQDIDRLLEINKKVGMNIAGEGGEFESLVINGPLFKKRLKIKESEIIMENEITGRFIIKKVEFQS